MHKSLPTQPSIVTRDIHLAALLPGHFQEDTGNISLNETADYEQLLCYLFLKGKILITQQAFKLRVRWESNIDHGIFAG